MSWFVTESKAYGGSRGLWRLIRYALSARRGDFAENVHLSRAHARRSAAASRRWQAGHVASL